jgi:hypothetical protein
MKQATLATNGVSNNFKYYNQHERQTMMRGWDVNKYKLPFATDGVALGALTYAQKATHSTEPGFKVAATNNYDFVIFKSGSITTDTGAAFVDEAFTVNNVTKFRNYGLKIGTYWYCRHINIYTGVGASGAGSYTGGFTNANITTHATYEATKYADQLESIFGVGNCGDIIPCLDWEDNRLHNADGSINTNYVITPTQAFLFMKTFCTTMFTRFPQLDPANGGNGIMLYSGYYHIGDGCGGNIQDIGGTNAYISAYYMPRLWIAANDPDLSETQSNYLPYELTRDNYNFKTFAGYTDWIIWQFSSDRNRVSKQLLTEGIGEDINVFDNYTFNFKQIWSKPTTAVPKGLDNDSKYARKNHTHASDYLPVKDGNLVGVTRVIDPDGFFMKQEKNKSWKIGRKSTNNITTDGSPELVLVPSSDNYEPANYVEGENWDTANAVSILPGNLQVSKVTIDSIVQNKTTTFEENDVAIAYTGSWVPTVNASSHGGNYTYSLTAGNYYQFTFYGTGLNLYGVFSTNRGQVEVFIDTVSKGIVDMYSPTVQYQKLFYSISGLAQGNHTVKVVVLATKNPASTSIVHAFDYATASYQETLADNNGLTTAKVKITPEGGIAIKLTNKTGSASVKGTVVEAHDTIDNAFQVAPTSDIDPIGICYDSGIVDGAECWVVVSGIAEILVVNAVATTRAYVALTSTTVAGRIDIVSPTTINSVEHFREVGHTLESKAAGTNVLVKCVIHFN